MSLQTLPDIDTAAYFFNSRELARLAVYRSAVAANFYTDQCDQTTPNSSNTAGLLQTIQDAPQTATCG